MKIIQLLPTIAYGDAVGNDCAAIYKILKDDGCDTAIYAENIDYRLPKGFAHRVSDMPRLSPDDILIYHLSTGTELNKRLKDFNCRKVIFYHNITPPDYFKLYDPVSFELCRSGLGQARSLAPYAEYCIADSEFNRQDLRQMGYSCPIDVAPILIPFEDYDKEPDAETMRQYSDGKVNILFTGRIAPNKRHEELIRAFAAFHRDEPNSRLILAGSYQDGDRYAKRLKRYVRELCLDESVVFTGHISFASILALYRTADVFWCMSDHEGFCVPLVEAMYFDIPIVAASSTAIPWTLGGSGVLLDEKDPELTAAVTRRLLADQELRHKVIEGQRERLADFGYEKTAALIRGYLRKIIEGRIGEEAPNHSDDIRMANIDGKGSAVDGEVSTVNGEENALDGKGSAVDGEVSTVNGEESALDGKGSTVDGKVSAVDGERNTVDGEESTPEGSGKDD